ncbi:beta-glucan synthesis-associated protein [Russula dissimulans]|nr:beta-glucan synthesis-associated protein [Russula dissimulans]
MSNKYDVSDLDTPSTTNLLPSGQPSVQAALLRGPRFRSTIGSHSLNESPYPSPLGGRADMVHSISDKFSLSPDPASWGSDLSPNHPEPDDYLHNPDPNRDRKNDRGGSIFTFRGLTNLGCLALLIVVLLALFAGYPIVTFFTRARLSRQGGFNLGGINGSGQVPLLINNRALIDPDTPQSAMTISSFISNDATEYKLVFSDEFNVEGRTFWEGDDPYWEAVNLHYWQTDDLEWYREENAITKDGYLQLTLRQEAYNNLNYTSAMVTSWNKFCFTGGIILASVSLPGASDILGLWPSLWTMGNLGRAGYGASLNGLWPYTYDSCDVGTAPNQTFNNQPDVSTLPGDPYNDGAFPFSQVNDYLPVHGSFVGRSAPEIDVFEATCGKLDKNTGQIVGQVSQSLQVGPFDYNYTYQEDQTSIPNPNVTKLNTYKGGVYQQAVSALSVTDQTAYELTGGGFSTYGFQYKPGLADAYICWISNGVQSWTLPSAALGADQQVQISARPIPQEPMYIIANLGISPSFGKIDFDHLTFPTTMRIDYIRIYQPSDQVNIGCDPNGYPTADYIAQFIEAYDNPLLTTWQDDYGQPLPGNSFLNQC